MDMINGGASEVQGIEDFSPGGAHQQGSPFKGKYNWECIFNAYERLKALEIRSSQWWEQEQLLSAFVE